MSAKPAWAREAREWLMAGLYGCGFAIALFAGLLVACVVGMLLLPLALVCRLVGPRLSLCGMGER
jgi:hypothetical protein